MIKDFLLTFNILSFQAKGKKFPSLKDLEKYLHQHEQKHGQIPPSLTTPVEISSMLYSRMTLSIGMYILTEFHLYGIEQHSQLKSANKRI